MCVSLTVLIIKNEVFYEHIHFASKTFKKRTLIWSAFAIPLADQMGELPKLAVVRNDVLFDLPK